MPDLETARSFLAQQALDARARAEKFRTFGENTRSPVARRLLCDIADDADRFATQTERRLAALRQKT